MSDVYADAYWTDEFEITTADLDRIAAHIRKTRQASDLTALSRRVIHGRLVHGPEDVGTPAQRHWSADGTVRLWDPETAWKPGDHVIVAVGLEEQGRAWNAPFVAEITEVVRGIRVRVQIDALGISKSYSVNPKYREQYQRWRGLVEGLVADRRGTKDVETQIEYVILEHGERVVGQLLEALRADRRFVRLAGRWFLRELAEPPGDEQITALAWALLPLEEPRPTAELVPLVQPALAEGDPGLFGLYLAMRDRPNLFENADPGQRPRWLLAGAPPGSCTPRHAAYDPETYEVLCLPDQPALPEAVQRLWALGLLRATA